MINSQNIKVSLENISEKLEEMFGDSNYSSPSPMASIISEVKALSSEFNQFNHDMINLERFFIEIGGVDRFTSAMKVIVPHVNEILDMFNIKKSL